MPVTSVVASAPGATETAEKCRTDNCTRWGFASRLRSRNSIVTFGGAEICGGVMAAPGPIVNVAGIRTLVSGAVGLLCLGALFLGTSGGRLLVVAVVVLGPALTVAVDVLWAVVAAAVALPVVPLAVVLSAELVELAEWLDPPHAAISSEASRVAQSRRRAIGAL